jgi:DME family drug/metabolite transporter
MTKTTKGIIYLITSAFIYSSLSVFIRFLNAAKVEPSAQTLMRYLFAFLIAGIYFKLSKSKFIFDKKNLLLLTLTAIFGYALTNFFFTYAIINTQVSTAMFIFYSFAILTPVLAFIFLKEKANKFNFISLGFGLLSLLLLFQPNALSTWKIGALFALLCALGQSFYLIARKKLNQYSAQQLMVTNTAAGVITMALFTLFLVPNFLTDKIMTLSLQSWLAALVAGAINFFGWLLMSKGFQLVKAATGSLVMLVENVFVVLIGLLFLSEIPTLTTIGGGLLVIAAGVLVTLKGDNS